MKIVFLLILFILKTIIFRLSKQTKNLTYLVHANIFIFCNFLTIRSFLILSFLFNLTTLNPISYHDTTILCILKEFSHGHKFIIKLDSIITWWIRLCFLKTFTMFDMSCDRYNETSGLKKHIIVLLLSTSGMQGSGRPGYSW